MMTLKGMQNWIYPIGTDPISCVILPANFLDSGFTTKITISITKAAKAITNDDVPPTLIIIATIATNVSFSIKTGLSTITSTCVLVLAKNVNHRSNFNPLNILAPSSPIPYRTISTRKFRAISFVPIFAQITLSIFCPLKSIKAGLTTMISIA